MVIDNETLKPLHELSEMGKQSYNEFLEKEADKILFKHDHPIRYLLSLIKEYLEIL